MRVFVVNFLLRTAFLLAGFGVAARAADFPFAEATIEGLQQRMEAGNLTARELTAAYLQRIAEIDQSGPRLNAVIEVNPDALAIAERLDAERKAGRVRGPLHGIPILIKDNIATADRMETTAGSLALIGARPPRDAHVVTRLREAGAVLLGKTNLSEWANFRGERSVSGWSGRGGQTRNPYALDRSPSGSSSGSAVAVAANLCVAAIGTETNGSIVSPASVCGIVGFKPTVGLASRSGIIPIAETFDTAGPMTRTVRDAALILAAIAGVDARDPATTPLPASLAEKIAAKPQGNALNQARIGLVRGGTPRADLVRELEAALATLRAAGAEVIDLGEYRGVGDSSSARTEIMLYEMKAGINAYLAEIPAGKFPRTMADLIKFNDENWAKEQPLFGQQQFTRAQARGPLTDPVYLDAREMCRRLGRGEGIDALTEKYQLNALVALTTGPAPLITPPASGDPLFGPKGHGGGGGSTLPAMAGYPSVTVPMAQIAGLPFGLMFYGRAWSEAELIALAADFEGRAQARFAPKFLKSAE